MRDVRDHLRDETGLEPDPGPLGRASDRLLQLIGLQRRDRLRPTREELAEARVDERPVVEVGTERDDHADPAVGIDRRHTDALEEVRPLALVRR